MGSWTGRTSSASSSTSPPADAPLAASLLQSVYVDVDVKPETSSVRVVDTVFRPDGTVMTTVRVTPADAFGNLAGPGRADAIQCATPKECSIDPKEVVYHGDGSYSIAIVTPPSVPGVRLAAFGTALDVALPCDDCPRLAKLTLEERSISEHNASRGTVQLTASAPKLPAGGALDLHQEQQANGSPSPGVGDGSTGRQSGDLPGTPRSRARRARNRYGVGELRRGNAFGHNDGHTLEAPAGGATGAASEVPDGSRPSAKQAQDDTRPLI